MGIFLEIAVAVLAALGAGTICWLLWGVTVLPIRGWDGKKLAVTLPPGTAEQLRRAAGGLIYLERMGILDARLDICRDGLDAGALAEAEDICRRHSCAELIQTKDESEGRI